MRLHVHQVAFNRRSVLITALAIAVIALFVFAEPHDSLVKADVIGYAACHRIPERSLHIDGRQLPLCARCTGIYLGLLTGWAFLFAKRRLRAAQLPETPLKMVLIGFIVLMGIDGLNSTAMLLGLPHVYETQNWMRVFTGSLYGLAVSLMLTPYVTLTLWREPTGDRTLKGWGELLLLVNGVGAFGALALTEAPFLLWPLVVVSVVGVVGLMGLLNLSITAALSGRLNAFVGWRDWLRPGLIGVALTLVEFVGIGVLRAGVP